VVVGPGKRARSWFASVHREAPGRGRPRTSISIGVDNGTLNRARFSLTEPLVYQVRARKSGLTTPGDYLVAGRVQTRTCERGARGAGQVEGFAREVGRLERRGPMVEPWTGGTPEATVAPFWGS
jgi:hypothetical protein